jgi:hypothetical protein
MSTTDTSEKGLETLIMRHMTGADGLAFEIDGVIAEMPSGNDWLAGNRFLKEQQKRTPLYVVR